MKASAFIAALALGLLPATLHGKTRCPARVTSAVERAYPDGKVKSCRAIGGDRHPRYRIRVATGDSRKVEVHASGDGAILQSEERIAARELPPVVGKSFKARFPELKIRSAEKWIRPDGSVNYEIHYWENGRRHAAAFREDGAFLVRR